MKIQINPDNVPVSDALEAHVDREVHTALRRFEPRITRVEVHLSNVNGPKGGVDQQCRMEARPAGRDPLFVEHLAADVYEAVRGAAEKLEKRVGRALERQQEHKAKQ